MRQVLCLSPGTVAQQCACMKLSTGISSGKHIYMTAIQVSFEAPLLPVSTLFPYSTQFEGSEG